MHFHKKGGGHKSSVSGTSGSHPSRKWWETINNKSGKLEQNGCPAWKKLFAPNHSPSSKKTPFPGASEDMFFLLAGTVYFPLHPMSPLAKVSKELQSEAWQKVGISWLHCRDIRLWVESNPLVSYKSGGWCMYVKVVPVDKAILYVKRCTGNKCWEVDRQTKESASLFNEWLNRGINYQRMQWGQRLGLPVSRGLTHLKNHRVRVANETRTSVQVTY